MLTLVESLLAGDRLALSRTLTRVENDTPEGRAALDELFSHTGQAHLVGVTGAPGVGKSSLVNQLALHYRKHTGKTIAILAVDPTSPFTGGAVLGDRVRMRDLAGDPGVFIRSMATRGTLGGLAHATAALTQVFDAAGFDLVLIETMSIMGALRRLPKLFNGKLATDPAKAAEHADAARKGERHVEKTYRKALADLFQGTDYINMFKRREIYRHLSNAADRMAHCANTLHDIVVKTS